MRHLLRSLASALAAHWRVGLLALVATLLWCAHYDRWTLASWTVPTNYTGDALEILTRIAATSEGDAAPLQSQIITRLGAPHGANWNAYPSSDLFLVWVTGQLARVIGVFAAANVALLLATLTAALSFYGCARWLRARWEWAFVGALLFAFTVQTFHRGLPHLLLVFSWTVPLALLACGLVAGSQRLKLSGWSGRFCLATAAVIGIGNPYTLFLFLQLVGWAVIAQWVGPRRRDNLVVGLLAIVIALTAFAAVESHVWLFNADKAATSPLVRTYAGTEIYALKPLELVVPPPEHRWPLLAQIGHRYERAAEWRGSESFMPYLGIVGTVGLVALGIATFRALLRRRRLPGPALPVGWVFAFATIGGITNIVALLTGVLVFRATNRFSIFISAAVLMFVVSRASRWWAHRPAWLSCAAAMAIATLGLADQLPRAPGRRHWRDIEARVRDDSELAQALERVLPPRAMVFQLPVMEFPETVPPHALVDYEYFRPYLATRQLCFSYGMLKRRSRGHWQHELASLPTAELVRRLERYGFAAVYFHRAGFGDGGEQLLRELAAAGRSQRIETARGEQVVVLLQPSPRPESPLARRLTFGRGWHGLRAGEPRWAYGPAALSYYNPLPHPIPARVRLVMSGVDERTVGIHVNDTLATEARVDPVSREIAIEVMLQCGPNRIDLESDRPAVRVGHGRNQLRAFAVHESAVTIDAAELRDTWSSGPRVTQAQ